MEWLSHARSNQEMVDKFTRLGIIESSDVERAFRCVSRAAFVPSDLLEDAFKDTPLRGSHHVHLSAPHMYATIMEELELDVGMSFLNVGSGTGYFSTLAGYIIKKDGINHGVELHDDLVKFANERVREFLENGPPDCKDICTPVFLCGNACRLDPDQMKYDRLYCGAACSQANVKFLLKMVKVGGFLIAPVGSRLIKLKRVSLKEGRQSVINDVSFAPLVIGPPIEMELPKLRFPNINSKKNKGNSVKCDVNFPVSKSRGRRCLSKLRAFQDALDCLHNEKPIPMPFCYVPCFDDLTKAKGKQKKVKEPELVKTNLDDSSGTAVDSQIEFFKGIASSVEKIQDGLDQAKPKDHAKGSDKQPSSHDAENKDIEMDWENLSSDKTWLEVLDHYYSVCATTESRKRQCTNVKVENPPSDQLKFLTFKKYAKQMGLLPPRSRKKSSKGDSKGDTKGDAPVVEEVANDIVENLLEEVISQVDENDLAEDFLAAVTGTGPYANGDIRRRSSVARAIILDNLPRLRACAEEAGGLSPTLQNLIRNLDSEDKILDQQENSKCDACDHKSESCDQDSCSCDQRRDQSFCSRDCSRESAILDMQSRMNSMIADIDKQILHDIVNDGDIGKFLNEDSMPPLLEPDGSDTSSVNEFSKTDTCNAEECCSNVLETQCCSNESNFPATQIGQCLQAEYSADSSDKHDLGLPILSGDHSFAENMKFDYIFLKGNNPSCLASNMSAEDSPQLRLQSFLSDTSGKGGHPKFMDERSKLFSSGSCEFPLLEQKAALRVAKGKRWTPIGGNSSDSSCGKSVTTTQETSSNDSYSFAGVFSPLDVSNSTDLCTFKCSNSHEKSTESTPNKRLKSLTDYSPSCILRYPCIGSESVEEHSCSNHCSTFEEENACITDPVHECRGISDPIHAFRGIKFDLLHNSSRGETSYSNSHSFENDQEHRNVFKPTDASEESSNLDSSTSDSRSCLQNRELYGAESSTSFDEERTRATFASSFCSENDESKECKDVVSNAESSKEDPLRAEYKDCNCKLRILADSSEKQGEVDSVLSTHFQEKCCGRFDSNNVFQESLEGATDRDCCSTSDVSTNSSLLASTPVHRYKEVGNSEDNREKNQEENVLEKNALVQTSIEGSNKVGNSIEEHDVPTVESPITLEGDLAITAKQIYFMEAVKRDIIAKGAVAKETVARETVAKETVSKEAIPKPCSQSTGVTCRMKTMEPHVVTSFSSSFKKKKKLRKSFTSVKMDVLSSEMLRSLPGKGWGLKHDKELVLYLSRKEKMSGHVAFSNCCASLITPQCFTSTDLIQYKKICSFPGTALARRGIVLKRLAEILDSVMNMLVGPSLIRDQFKTPSDVEYPLRSISGSSFESSGIPLNFNAIQERDAAEDTTLDNEKPPLSEKSLVKTVECMILHELENVKKQKEIVHAKLNLYDSLIAEYDQQLTLIKEQVGLVEEQEQLLRNRLRLKFPDGTVNQERIQFEQTIQERKSHWTQLIQQVDRIQEQQREKSAEHQSLFELHKRLTGLENRLLEEQVTALKMGRKYFERDKGKLTKFTKYVEKSHEIVSELQAMNENPGHVIAPEKSDSEIHGNSKENKYEKDRTIPKHRYHPHLMLSKSRFLFPLTSKRLAIIRELLRMSETYSMYPCYVARINRRVPLKERHKYPASNTVFMQTYHALKNKELNFRDVKRNFEKLWEVRFIGEGVIDQGGGFRDSLAEIADELCPAAPEIKECLNLFIKTPNQQNKIGDHRDAYIPNPSCKDFHLYTWIGKLMGAAFRTDETLTLSLSPFIWKLLIGEHVSWSADYAGIDETIVRVTDGMELLDKETYESIGTEQFHIVHLSDGTEKSLLFEDGNSIPVSYEEREKYAKMVRETRMLESAKQVKAIQDGLFAVVPEALLSCLTWQDFERGVCGSPEISVQDLKANCRYELDLSPSDDCVTFLWETLTSFSNEERARFIRFVTGRKRLPSPFFVSKSLCDENSLPTASTCGTNLFLPNYTNAKIAADKIRYAINNCVSIDTDTSPW